MFSNSVLLKANVMNLAQLITKDLKQNRKSLSKLRNILINPIKTECPPLNEDEFKGLCSLLRNVICQSGLKPQQFKAAKQTHLGLKSSVQAINNCHSSCILISLNIKRSHIISLIVI
uniref:Uncharacterized protein n=1 Tax=Glossina brevipalpis TaxID=37001 RepID=A0A1A9X4Q5_9MUSC